MVFRGIDSPRIVDIYSILEGRGILQEFTSIAGAKVDLVVYTYVMLLYASKQRKILRISRQS